VRGLVSFLLAIAVVSSPAYGVAAERRVALVRGDAELQRQLELALQAWEVETVALDVPPPAVTQPEAMNEAADLATRLRLNGVVWVTDAEQGSLLWVYDAHSGEVTIRAVAERPPFASAIAAGLALSVKTTLRASVEPPPVAPPAPPAPPSPPPPPPPPPPIPDDEWAPLPSAPRSLVAPRAQVTLGVDAQAVSGQTRRAWYSIQSALWLGKSRRAGVGLRVGLASALPLETPALSGQFDEFAFGPSFELRLASSSAFVAQAFVGGSLHAATLTGTLATDRAPVEVRRYNLAVDAGGRLDLRVAGDLLLGLELGAAYFLRYQRFTVDGAAVFAPWRLVPSGGAHVGFELY